MAAPVAKASWTADSAAALGMEVAEAVRIALSGRPGPGAPEPAVRSPGGEARRCAVPLADEPRHSSPQAQPLQVADAEYVLAEPLPGESGRWSWPGRSSAIRGDLVSSATSCESALGVPVIPMESPRGINDPRLGAFAEVLRRGRSHRAPRQGARFHAALRRCTRRRSRPAASSSSIRRTAMLERVAREKGQRLACSVVADARPASAGPDRARTTRGTKHHAAWTERGALGGRLSPRRLGDARLGRARQAASRRALPRD